MANTTTDGWTAYTFRCQCCKRYARVSSTYIEEYRRGFEAADMTDAQIAATAEECIACTSGVDAAGEHMTHCQGCDEDQPNVRRFIHTSKAGEESVVRYCEDCRDLARADFNGDTLSVEAA